MGFFNSILSFFFLLFFGGTGRGGRHHRGLFGTGGHNPLYWGSSRRGSSSSGTDLFVSMLFLFIALAWTSLTSGVYVTGRRRGSARSGSRRDSSSRTQRTSSTRSASVSTEVAAAAAAATATVAAAQSRRRKESDSERERDRHAGDALYARLEDMEQFYNSDHSFNATEHGYDWDEIVDAMAEGCLPEDYAENMEEDN